MNAAVVRVYDGNTTVFRSVSVVANSRHWFPIKSAKFPAAFALLFSIIPSHASADPIPVTFIWHNGIIATIPYYTSNGATFLPATVNSINDSGYVAGATVNGAQLYRSAATWNGTTFTSFGTLPGHLESVANGINNAGALVGASYTNGGNSTLEPTEWIGGQILDLGLAPGFTKGFADGINDHGQIVGIQFTQEAGEAATLWSNGQVTTLAAISGYSEAIAINNSGVIVGGSNSGAVIWRDEVMSPLPCAGGANAYSINDAGQAVGICGNDAVVWDTANGTVTDLGPGLAQSINNKGMVVGRTGTDVSNPLTEQTFIWSVSGGMQIIPGFLWSEPFAINNNGYVVGVGELAPSAPAPEPRSLALLSIAITLFAVRLQFRKIHPHS